MTILFWYLFVSLVIACIWEVYTVMKWTDRSISYYKPTLASILLTTMLWPVGLSAILARKIF